MKGFLLLSLLLLAKTEDGVDCPDFLRGYNYNSEANDEQTYWHCPDPDSEDDTSVVQSVQLECDEGALYDAIIGDCKNGTSQRDIKKVEQLEIEALTITNAHVLGALYNARTHTFTESVYLWDQTVVDQNMITQDKEYSNLDIYQETNLQDRVDKLNIDKDLAIRVMGKELANFGTFSYLKEDKTSTNTARVVMSYQSTKVVQSLPLTTPVTYSEVCHRAESNDGDTHAVTGVVRGLRAFLTFDKEATEDETVEKIGAKLLADVNLVPSFVKTASGWVDVDNKEVKKITNLRVKYHGNNPLNVVTDYESALEAFNNIEEAAQTATVPVRYVLTPLSFLCEGHTPARVHPMNEQLLNRAVEILTELQEAEEEVSALIESRAAALVPSLRERLDKYKEQLQQNELQTTRAISNKVESIKKGEGTEGELVTILRDHETSEYAADSTSTVLESLSKEVAAIMLIVDEVEEHNEAAGVDIFTIKENSKDIQCVIAGNRAIKYEFFFRLKVVRPESSSEIIQEDESGLWYNDLTKVGEIGAKLQAFLAFGSASWTGETDQHCFIIAIDEMLPGDTDFVSISYNCKDPRHSYLVKGDNFIPPEAPPKPVCTPSYDSCQVATSSSSNDFVTAHYVVAKSPGNPDVVDKHNPVNEAELSITGLDMNTAYDVTTKYKVLDATRSYFEDLGFSPSSEPTPCITAPSSEVRYLTMSGATDTTLTVSWTKPLHFAQDADIRYILKVKESEEPEEKSLIISLDFEEVTTVVSGLVPATIYDVIIFTQTDLSSSSVTESSMTTAPGKLEFPQVQEVRTVGSVYIRLLERITSVEQQLNTAMSSPKLVVEYTELGDEIGKGEMETKTQTFSSGQDIDVYIRDLSLGRDYEITLALQVNYKTTSLLLTSPPTDILRVTIPIKGTVVEIARHNLEVVKQTVEASLDDITDSVNKLEPTVQDLTRDVTSYLEATRQELADFVGKEEILSGILKKSCIDVGWQYSSESGQLDSQDDVYSVYECLNHCRVTEGCNSVSWDKAGSSCTTFKERVGGERTANANTWTANRVCYDTMTALSDKWQRCLETGVSWTGGDIEGKDSQGVNTIWDCWEWCLDTPGCQAVSFFEDARMCQLKENADGVIIADTNYVSIRMECLTSGSTEEIAM